LSNKNQKKVIKFNIDKNGIASLIMTGGKGFEGSRNRFFKDRIMEGVSESEGPSTSNKPKIS
jgi:hypothetical protein